jgi:predicted metal-dependent phosphoesterase TrpH
MTDGLRLDLHVHSLHSPDSRLSLEEIAGRLPFAGMQGFALTDHNTTAGHREIESLRAGHPGLLVIPGVEISTREGHLLAYGVSEAPAPHRPLAETLEAVSAQGGVAVLAHPFRLSHGVGRRVARVARVDAIEAVNGHTSRIANARAELVAAERHLGTTGGSDVHELGDLGRAFTEFPSEIGSVAGLLEALRDRRTTGNGTSLTWAGRVRWSLRTSALRVARGFRAV